MVARLGKGDPMAYMQDWDTLKGLVNLSAAHAVYPYRILVLACDKSDVMGEECPRPVRDFSGNRPRKGQ